MKLSTTDDEKNKIKYYFQMEMMKISFAYQWNIVFVNDRHFQAIDMKFLDPASGFKMYIVF